MMSTENISWGEKIVQDRPQNAGENILNATQDYVNRILATINPVNELDLPYILAALKIVTNAMRDHRKVADLLSNEIVQALDCHNVKMRVPENMSQEELEQLKNIFCGGRRENGTI